jgi:hypothetical protein
MTSIDITCAKNGVSENELEDILSCDDDVLNDIYEWYAHIQKSDK